MEPEFKICPLCNENKPKEAYKIQEGQYRNNVCKTCLGKRYRTKLKLDVLNAFNRECDCCGETNPHFLTLDHVQNDGNIHRQELNNYQCMAEARKEGFPKEKYQLLCMNCNFAKGHYGECPHKLGLTSEELYEKLEKTQIRFGKKFQNSRTAKNLNGLAKAREVLKEIRIENGQVGEDAATRSRKYRERHPEYKDRKKELRQQTSAKAMIQEMTPEQIQQLIQSLGVDHA
ncbi:MAG TPA: hypothetical protein VGF75_08015 [Candidatus Saccharimonadales bacterium]|jgi:hypothetical protein